MSLDCYIAKLKNIKPHPNADKLDIAMVNNWQVVIGRDSWSEDEPGLFICPDACLPLEEDWSKPYLSYLGKGGRVKIVKLRGEYSNGLIIKLKEITTWLENKGQKVNLGKISSEELSSFLNITHYSVPVPQDLAISSATLPYGLRKTDEENWQSLDNDELHLGEEALVTRKMDGCSATYTAHPDGTFICCGRRFTYHLDKPNRYTSVGMEQVYKPLIAYAQKHNKVIVVRGEITGQGIQKFGINLDNKGNPTFNLYNCTFPDEPDYNVRHGHYGNWSHFLEVNKELGLNTVPILGKIIISKELLLEYQNAPASNGEGVVLNFKNGSYKAKSADYYSKIK